MLSGLHALQGNSGAGRPDDGGIGDGTVVGFAAAGTGGLPQDERGSHEGLGDIAA